LADVKRRRTRPINDQAFAPKHWHRPLFGDGHRPRYVANPRKCATTARDCEVVGGAVAEELFAKGLCLPSGTAMSEADMARVVEVIRTQAKNN